MKIPKFSRQTRLTLAVLGLIGLVGWFGYYAYSSFNFSASTSANVKGPTAITVASAIISYPAPNSTTTTCTVSGNTATCPQVQLTQGGSATEAGNYTITLTFTATPAGAQINVLCASTGVLACPTSPPPVFATGASQTASVFIRPGGSGTGTATVSLVG